MKIFIGVKNWVSGEKQKTRYLCLFISAIIIVLLLPALLYSVRTHFALIDDYNSWMIVKTFSNLGSLKDWFISQVLIPGSRFRPDFDLYNLLTWFIFRTNYALHHLFRWIVKLIIIIFAYKSFQKLGTLFSTKILFPFFVFLAIFTFYPNNPEARLAPQELLIVLFFSIAQYYLIKLITTGSPHFSSRVRDYLLLLVSFLFMVWAKEPAVVFGIVFLFFIAYITIYKTSDLLYLLPFVIIVVNAVVNVLRIEGKGGYGTSVITISLIQKNFLWYFTHLYLIDISQWIIIIFLIPLLFTIFFFAKDFWAQRKGDAIAKTHIVGKVLQLRNNEKQFVILLFLIASFLGFFIFTTISFEGALRYYYPLVFLLAFITGFCVLEIMEHLQSKSTFTRLYLIFTCICAIYFVGVNYYNFVYQFAIQYYLRENENNLLIGVRTLLDHGDTVYVIVTSEYEAKIRDYFSDYLPYYEDETYPNMKFVNKDALTENNVYLATQDSVPPSGYKLVYEYVPRRQYRYLAIFYQVSSFLAGNKSLPTYRDDGVGNINYIAWYIYTNVK